MIACGLSAAIRLTKPSASAEEVACASPFTGAADNLQRRIERFFFLRGHTPEFAVGVHQRRVRHKLFPATAVSAVAGTAFRIQHHMAELGPHSCFPTSTLNQPIDSAPPTSRWTCRSCQEARGQPPTSSCAEVRPACAPPSRFRRETHRYHGALDGARAQRLPFTSSKTTRDWGWEISTPSSRKKNGDKERQAREEEEGS